MGKKKAVFFDIDNTLWDFQNRIPPSAIAAIRRLRRNGHLALICSGRSRAFIQNPALLAIGFDGILSGCGTLLEYQGRTLFYHQVAPPLAEQTVRALKSYGFRIILEGREYLYFDPEDFAGDLYGDKLTAELGDRLRTVRDHWGVWEMSKLSCDTRGCDQAAGLHAVAADFDAIVHNENVVELVPRGFSKGSGIRRFCSMIGHDPADTVAFGDSNNDLDMLETCGVGVAMGNAAEHVKQCADMVTTDLHDDGIWNACEKLGLI